jgi:ketosteroid isomerase-like protein
VSTARISFAAVVLVYVALPAKGAVRAEAPEATAAAAAEIKRLEQKLARAVVANDVGALRRIEAEGYVHTDSDAKVDSREDFIRAYQAGKSTVRSLAFDDLVVDVYGDAAVVRGVLTVDRVTDGIPIRRVSRYSRFYVRFPKGWQAVAGHSSAMKKPDEGRPE